MTLSRKDFVEEETALSPCSNFAPDIHQHGNAEPAKGTLSGRQGHSGGCPTTALHLEKEKS